MSTALRVGKITERAQPKRYLRVGGELVHCTNCGEELKQKSIMKLHDIADGETYVCLKDFLYMEKNKGDAGTYKVVFSRYNTYGHYWLNIDREDAQRLLDMLGSL